jgi:hypothetical protein
MRAPYSFDQSFIAWDPEDGVENGFPAENTLDMWCEPLELGEDAKGTALGDAIRWNWDGYSLRVRFTSLDDTGTEVEQDLEYGLDFFEEQDEDAPWQIFLIAEGRPSELSDPWPKMAEHLPDREMQFTYYFWGSEHPERRFHCGYAPIQGRPCGDQPCADASGFPPLR